MTTLGSAEDVSCAPNFEVAHGDFKASAEGAVLFDGVDAFAGFSTAEHIAWEEEISVGFVLGTTDPTPELVEVGEAKAIGAVDDDGVGVGDIEATFDDRGGDQNICLATDKGLHDFFEFVLVHLSVSDDQSGLWAEKSDAVANFFDGLDAIMKKVDLALAGEFAVDGVADDAFIVGADERFGRDPIGGRGFDGAHVFRAHQGEIEGSGNGGSGEGEEIDELKHLFKPFLMQDSEALFFVDDHEAEVFKVDIFGNQSVGADDDIDVAGFQSFDGFSLFGGGAEAGESFDSDGVIAEAFAKVLVVLLGEDSGGN